MTAAGDPTATIDDIEARVAAGEMPEPAAVPDPVVARLVGVALEAGSPVLPALAATARACRDRSEIADGVRVATAQARAVAMGLLALPLVLVPGLGGLLDLDLLAFYRTPVGTVVATVAGALTALGGSAVWLLLRRAIRSGRPPADGAATDDETVDLLATAMDGATAAGAACRLAADRVPERSAGLRRLALALELGHPIDLPAPLDRAHRVLERSGRLGAPAAPALRRLAAAIRADRRTRALESAQRLPALLAFPTALCLLPASVLAVGAPLVAAGLAGATGTP